jgi:hypothetical protein
LRFSKGHAMDRDFYVRGDGTAAYFFSTEDLASVAQHAGFEVVETRYLCRVYVNRATKKEMRRVWVHAEFRKPSSVEPHASTGTGTAAGTGTSRGTAAGGVASGGTAGGGIACGGAVAGSGIAGGDSGVAEGGGGVGSSAGAGIASAAGAGDTSNSKKCWRFT